MKRFGIATGSCLLALACVGALAVPAQGASASLTPSNCGKVSENADGTLSPIICPNGHPNAKVWASIRTGTPHMAELGAHPTWRQVKAATCADVRDSTYPIVTDSYQWLATRNNWLGMGLPGAETFGRRVVNGMCG